MALSKLLRIDDARDRNRFLSWRLKFPVPVQPTGFILEPSRPSVPTKAILRPEAPDRTGVFP